MKTLYILISDGGDGSYYPHYTFDGELIRMLSEMAYEDIIDYESGIGIDGDGFHYEELTLPDEVTAKSLGISEMSGQYWKDMYAAWKSEEQEEEDE